MSSPYEIRLIVRPHETGYRGLLDFAAETGAGSA